jgi:hypothetical protein
MRRPDVRPPGEVAAALTAGPLRMRLFVSRPLTGSPRIRVTRRVTANDIYLISLDVSALTKITHGA